MADNVSITPGTGTTIASEDVSGVQHQKVKIEFGGDGVATMVSASDPLPVSATIDTTGLATDATDDNTATIAGAVSGTEMQVDVITMPTVAVTQSGTWDEVGINDSGNSITVDGNLGADLRVSSAAVTTSNPVPVQPPASGYLNISIDQTGNNNAVDVLTIAAGDNNIGNVDIVSGTVTTVTTLTGGGIAHDSADSGNPHKIGFKAYSPDGTTPGTAVAEGDRTDAKGNLDGQLFVQTEHPRWGSYHVDGSSALTDATVAASPGAGFQIVITNITFSSGSATAINMFLEEGSTKIFGPIYLEAIAGRGFCTPAGFRKHVTASTAVTITTSAAIAHSVDIQYEIVAV